MFILEWFNLLFVLPFGLALLYLFLYAATGLTFGEADADVGDADVDGDLDADMDADVDADMDADADLHADVAHSLDSVDHADVHAFADGGHADHGHVDHGHHDHAGGSYLSTALSIFGIGRVPLSLGLMIFCFTWGILGVMTTHATRAIMPIDWMTLLIAAPVAFVGATLVTNAVARAVARWMPTVATSAEKREALVGRSGEAITNIDTKFGQVAVRDRRGELYHLPARTEAGRPIISKGERVVLYDYLNDEQLYLVALFREKLVEQSETTPGVPPAPKRISEGRSETATESQETIGGGNNAVAN